MDIDALRTFFMWCTILNAGLLMLSVLMCATAGGWIYRWHSKFFPMSREAFNTALYTFLGGYKVLVFVFNVVPFVVLLIMT